MPLLTYQAKCQAQHGQTGKAWAGLKRGTQSEADYDAERHVSVFPGHYAWVHSFYTDIWRAICDPNPDHGLIPIWVGTQRYYEAEAQDDASKHINQFPDHDPRVIKQ